MRIVPCLALLILCLGVTPLRAEEDPLVVRAPRAAPADDADLEGLARRVLEAPDEDLEALARAVACLDLGAARTFVAEVRARAGDAGASPRAWPPLLGPLDPHEADDEGKPPADGPLVQITTRVLEMPLQRLFSVPGAIDASDSTFVASLDDAQAKDLLQMIEGAKDVTQLTAPRLSAYSGQRATISLLNQVSYIQDYEIERGQDGSTIADPIIAVVNDGLALDLRGTASTDRRFVTLEIASTWSDLKRPIQEMTVAVGPSTATVQVPQVDVHQMRTTVRLPAGGHVVVVDGTPRDREGTSVNRVLLIEATLVD